MASLRKSIDVNFFHEYATSKMGVCHTHELRSLRDEVYYSCRNGHSFSHKAVYSKRGNWCKHCLHESRRNYTEASLHEMATRHGGVITQLEGLRLGAKVHCKCEENHQWTTTVEMIKAGSWCPTCGRISAGLKRRRGKYEK